MNKLWTSHHFSIIPWAQRAGQGALGLTVACFGPPHLSAVGPAVPWAAQPRHRHTPYAAADVTSCFQAMAPRWRWDHGGAVRTWRMKIWSVERRVFTILKAAWCCMLKGQAWEVTINPPINRPQQFAVAVLYLSVQYLFSECMALPLRTPSAIINLSFSVVIP